MDVKIFPLFEDDFFILLLMLLVFMASGENQVLNKLKSSSDTYNKGEKELWRI